MPLDAQTPVAELEALVAERLTLRCTHDALLAWDIPGASRDCPDCGGSEERHPLRQPVIAYCNPLRFDLGYESCTKESEGDCQGHVTGYVFNLDPDALTDAIRAMGWSRWEFSLPAAEGDAVSIYGYVDGEWQEVAKTSIEEEIRGRHALLLATARAVED